MKQIVMQLLYNAERNLYHMKKSEMSLSERIKYERALVELNCLKEIIYKSVINNQ